MELREMYCNIYKYGDPYITLKLEASFTVAVLVVS